MEKSKKYLYAVIFVICLIIGFIRALQISLYELSIGKPTMTGAFTLYSYIFVAICLISISLIFTDIGYSKFPNTLKTIVRIISIIIGVLLICCSLLFFH
jgi:predicted membrane protein